LDPLAQPRTQAHIALFAVNLIYGANYTVAKSLMPGVIGPSGFILVRVVGASLLFWALMPLYRERVSWADVPRLLLCAVLGVALNQLMFFQGLMRTSALHASLIMVVAPILVLVFAAVLIGERVTRAKVAGILLGATGASLLLWLSAQGGDAGSTLLGDVCILINAASYALYLVLVKPLMRKYSAVTIMAWTFLFGTVMVLPFGAHETAKVDWQGLAMGQWIAIAFVVLLVTFVVYLLNTWALRRVEPSVVGTYIYLQPVMAIVFGWLYLWLGWMPGEGNTATPDPGIAHALSAGCIFLGVHLVNRADRQGAA